MITTETLNKLAEMQQAKTEALAKMPQDAYDKIKTALLNKLNSIDNSFEGLLKNLLLIAANWKQLGMPAINGLVAYAVAGEMLTKTTEPSQKETTTEVKEVTTEEWLALAEKTRLAWLSRKSDNHAEYKRCQAISHEAHDTWQRQLKLAVYS